VHKYIPFLPPVTGKMQFMGQPGEKHDIEKQYYKGKKNSPEGGDPSEENTED
jgi:hypothetical protein